MKSKGIWKSRLGAVAGMLLATMIGLFVAVVAAPVAVPTLRFYCMDFNLMTDGSVQALVRVEAENLAMFRGTDFNLQYNDDYLIPSTVNDNKPYGDQESPITRDFFRVDSKLYAGNDPFAVGQEERYGSVNRKNSTLTLDLGLDQTALSAVGENQLVGKIQTSSPDIADLVVAYVNTDVHTAVEDGVSLGELSFWVPPDKITEMVEKYSAATPVTPPLLVATKPVGIDRMTNAWELLYYELTPSDVYGAKKYHQDSGDTVAKVEYIFEFPNTLIKADLPEDFVRLNAWEAYADGTWDDVAADLQRYAGQITAGYANGNLKNFVFPWGKANTADVTAPQSDYTVYTLNAGAAWTDEASLKALPDTSWTQVTTGTDTYNPQGGVYKVQQYFLYTEEGTDKRYPVARTAYLVIDPVELTGAWAKDWEKTYRKSDAPQDFDSLRLPAEAILRVAPGLGKVSLTVPIDGWSPDTLPSDLSGGVAGTYQFTPKFAQPTLNDAAQARYPWLTLGSATLGVALRTVVSDTAVPDPSAVGYALTATHGAGHNLVLDVKKVSLADGSELDIPVDSVLTFYQPDGTVIAMDWWNPALEPERVDPDANRKFQYHLEADPDGGDTVGYATQLETLTRAINLGGWFAVTVDEGGVGVDPATSDKVYGYLAPRPNLHTQSYIGAADPGTGKPGAFQFTGYYAGLLPLYATSVDASGVATVNPFASTVTLPTGYTVATTYDGATGREPGKLGVVRVDAWQCSTELNGAAQTGVPAPWPVAKGETLKAFHGADNFLDGAVYDAFGRVENPVPEQQVEIDVEFANLDGHPPEIKPVESLAIYEGNTAVTGVVYDTRQKGYVAREERTLTIKNTGTTDVSGIWLDMDFDPYGKANGEKGHFEILRAPASYLPAGGETTFVITYVYNLDYYIGSNAQLSGTTYQDAISVNTNQTTAATQFTARFRVTKGAVSPVSVVTIPTFDAAKPGNNQMGTAMIISGLGEGLPNPVTDLAAKPDSTAGNLNYEEAYQYVWIQANPISEYSVKEVYYYAGNNPANKVSIPAYLYDGSNGDAAGEYYYFQMPGHSTTVYVEFEESIRSKLRLSSLLVYSGVEADVTGIPGATNSDLIDGLNPETRLQVLRRDDKATNAVLTYPSNTAGAPDTAAKFTLTESESSYPGFFSVLPAEADYVQLSLTLRQTLEMLGLDNTTVINNPLNSVKVLITTPSTGGSGGADVLCDNSSGTTGNPPSQHKTFVFDAPDKGGEKVVTVTLSYEDASVAPSVHYERAFQVRLVRLTGDGLKPNLGYGNSPYGMIMNDAAISDKDQAKADFQAGNAFAVGQVPAKARGLTNVYWPEAPGYKDGQPVSAWGTTNYDRDDTALFVMVGQPFRDPGIRGDLKDSAGNPVDLSKVTLSVDSVDVLTAAGSQVGRFSSTRTATITLTETLDIAASTTGVAATWSAGTAIRPGAYTMTYTLKDYDGTVVTFDRPLIILTQPGDVNADGATDAVDEALFQNRVTVPLGYTVDTWPWAQLFRLRVADGNNDRIINLIDANEVRAAALTPYYLPVDYK